MSKPRVHSVTVEDVKEFYDGPMGAFFKRIWGQNVHFGYWEEWQESKMTFHEAQENLTNLLMERMNPVHGQHILDVGCGFGEPALKFAKSKHVKVSGITVSEKHLEGANEKAKSEHMEHLLDFQLANAMKLPFPDKSFDHALALESLFHMPDRTTVLKEICRVLKPGGKLVLTDFIRTKEPDSLVSDFVEPAFKIQNFYHVDQYSTLLRNAGLEPTEVRNISKNCRPTFQCTLDDVKEQASLLNSEGPENFADLLHETWAKTLTIYDTGIIGIGMAVAYKR
jgi:O-methyltransferase StaMB